MKSRAELKLYYLANPNAGEHILSYLVELLDNDKEDVMMMLEFYYEELEETKNEIVEGISNEEYEKIFKAAHKLKGSLGNVGLFEEQEIMTKIETYSKEESNLELINTLYDSYLKIAEVNEALIQEAKTKL